MYNFGARKTKFYHIKRRMYHRTKAYRTVSALNSQIGSLLIATGFLFVILLILRALYRKYVKKPVMYYHSCPRASRPKVRNQRCERL